MNPASREDIIGMVVILFISLTVIFGLRHSVKRHQTPEIACQRFCQQQAPGSLAQVRGSDCVCVLP